MYLTFAHATVGAVQRDRRLGRIWKDREPAAYLEPFNLLHRNQMMENEPPEHTRLRRPVASAFNRGHVERLRPRVRELAAGCWTRSTRTGFDVIAAYAEPLPVLVIADLLGVPRSYGHDLRDWSQAIVRMYEVAPSPATVDDAVRAAADFAGTRPRAGRRARRSRPAEDLITDLVATELTEDEVVAAVVLLLNAGHEASVNVFGNGLVAMLRRGLRPGADVALDGRGDAALRLGPAALRAHRDRDGRRPGGRRPRRGGPEDRRAARCRPTATLRSSTRPDEFRVDRTPTRTWPSVSGCTSASGLRWHGWSSASRWPLLFETFPDLALAASRRAAARSSCVGSIGSSRSGGSTGDAQ